MWTEIGSRDTFVFMLVFPSSALVFLAIPRTATTSMEAALHSAAALHIPKDLFPKHIPARTFFKRWEKHYPNAPKLDAFAVIREPIDRLKSWYLYRQREAIIGSVKSTVGMTFEDFIEEYLADDRKPRANIGNQFSFCSDESGQNIVKHLIEFGNLPVLADFIQTRIGLETTLPHLNASRSDKLELSRRAIARLEQANAAEFELYHSVAKHGWKTF